MVRELLFHDVIGVQKNWATLKKIAQRLVMPIQPITAALLSEPPRNVVGSLLLLRLGEQIASGAHFNQLAGAHKTREVRTPRGLLHVVRDDHDRVVALELRNKLLNFRRRNRIER